MVGCSCPVCTSGDSRDKRTRAGVYIKGNSGERVLIDAGPEFRLQAVRAGITRLDAVFLTHAHADHIHGLDDLRSLCWDNPIPVYGNEPTIAEMKERFSYIWKATQIGGGKPRLMPVTVNGPVQIGCLSLTPVPVKHGVLDILGWEVQENVQEEKDAISFLYLTDTSAIPLSTQAQLLDSCHSRVIIIGGLRMQPHETHFSFEQALNAANSLRAESVYLTHICHSHFHEEIEEFCQSFRKSRKNPVSVFKKPESHPAYDGLELII
jgi:phosphoribosyl 1,2-cyclic phosphate phosphodiesterase